MLGAVALAWEQAWVEGTEVFASCKLSAGCLAHWKLYSACNSTPPLTLSAGRFGLAERVRGNRPRLPRLRT